MHDAVMQDDGLAASKNQIILLYGSMRGSIDVMFSSSQALTLHEAVCFQFSHRVWEHVMRLSNEKKMSYLLALCSISRLRFARSCRRWRCCRTSSMYFFACIKWIEEGKLQHIVFALWVTIRQRQGRLFCLILLCKFFVDLCLSLAVLFQAYRYTEVNH